MSQSGSVWNSNRINLKNSFDFWFNVFLGCKDGDGADGIVFILQPLSTSVGTVGAGMGFEGVQPSIGIALDTWQNVDINDPWYDHISIQANGLINHNNDLAGPEPISATVTNVEDCKWHVLRIVWDAGTRNLQAYFDGVLRVEKQIDLVANIFNNDPSVFWGFTGATGGMVNLQQFCTALNPIFSTDIAGNNGCAGAPVQFSDRSESFAPNASYNRSFGNGVSAAGPKPPAQTYLTAGKYPVTLAIKGQDGCEKDSTILVTIGSKPTAAFTVFDTCAGAPLRLAFTNTDVGVSYEWSVNGNLFSSEKQPQFPALAAGQQNLQLTVTSDFNCGPPASAAASFIVKPRPEVTPEVEDGCVKETLSFNALQQDNSTVISQWQWIFGDGNSAASRSATHQFQNPGEYNVGLLAIASNGCASEMETEVVTVNAATVFAGRDTAVIKDLPFQLHGSGNGAFSWSPANGLSDPLIADPVVTLSNDQSFVLTVTTAEGCTASDTVLIKTFKGPAIYLPTAFTPNGDGKNDQLRPVYVGIKELKRFTVFNRWGQVVFSTTNQQNGWEGREAPVGTYVWVISAVNNLGQPMTAKGTVTLIR